MSEVVGFGSTSASDIMDVREARYTMPVSGSSDPPGQFEPPAMFGRVNVPSGPSTRLTTGGVKIGPSLYREAISTAVARSSGVKSTRSSIVTPWRS